MGAGAEGAGSGAAGLGLLALVGTIAILFKEAGGVGNGAFTAVGFPGPGNLRAGFAMCSEGEEEGESRLVAWPKISVPSCSKTVLIELAGLASKTVANSSSVAGMVETSEPLLRGLDCGLGSICVASLLAKAFVQVSRKCCQGPLSERNRDSESFAQIAELNSHSFLKCRHFGTHRNLIKYR